MSDDMHVGMFIGDGKKPRPLKFKKVWLLSNMGNPWGIYDTRRQARTKAEYISDEPWKRCQKYLEVRKVTLVEGW